MDLRFTVQTRIQKPVEEVFDAVHSPEKLSGYFTNGGASAPLHEGTTVEWAFADDPGDEKIRFPVQVTKVVPNELIVLCWEGAPGLDTRVEIRFENAEGDTVVSITETGWRDSQADLDSSYMNCFGWGQMLCCLKAFVEYGVDLRKGAYKGLFKSSEHHDGARYKHISI